MFHCREISDKEKWEDFLSKCPERTFLQSWNWGEFQERMGNKIWRLAIYDRGGTVINSVALVAKITARRGKFLLVQHGPAFRSDENKKEILSSFTEELGKIGRREGTDFIRMNPLLKRSSENEEIFKNLGFKEAPIHANAYEATWKLDITPPEDSLLAGMRKTTRYLIRQSLKNLDVSVEKSENASDIEYYQKLNEEVAGRQKFVPFSKEYIRNEFEVFLKDKEALLFFGKYKGELAAAALIVFWSGIGFYHQAASRPEYQKFSVPYLLQWEAVKEAKKRGCLLYDFWGFVDPKENPRHPWAGPTLFKMGFGGRVQEYIKTRDYPLSGKYRLINLFERARKIKRSL
jgi:peptidoglycan pentaglycine glycine transferase (the first glycine)